MNVHPPATIHKDDLAILVIDMQPYFLDGWMAGSSERLIARIRHLFGLAIAYDLPCLATFEQPVKKKGWLPEKLESAFPSYGQKLTKHTFNCCGEPAIREALRSIGRTQFAIVGGETDVCVLQSVLGLISEGYQVFLLEDCLYSSEPHVGPALRRMEQAGAVPSTVKMLGYELRQSVANPSEKSILEGMSCELILGDPESLPEWTSPR
jgi:nicotinamidase-related amidase